MNITELKLKIDTLKEYIDTELCKKCEQMQKELKDLEDYLKQYLDNSANT